MPTRAGRAFEAWRAADKAAREAEHVLQEAWNTYALEHGSPPARDLIQKVTQLRGEAHSKLTDAIAVVDSEVELNKRPRPTLRGGPSSQ